MQGTVVHMKSTAMPTPPQLGLNIKESFNTALRQLCKSRGLTAKKLGISPYALNRLLEGGAPSESEYSTLVAAQPWLKGFVCGDFRTRNRVEIKESLEDCLTFSDALAYEMDRLNLRLRDVCTLMGYECVTTGIMSGIREGSGFPTPDELNDLYTILPSLRTRSPKKLRYDRPNKRDQRAVSLITRPRRVTGKSRRGEEFVLTGAGPVWTGEGDKSRDAEYLQALDAWNGTTSVPIPEPLRHPPMGYTPAAASVADSTMDMLDTLLSLKSKGAQEDALKLVKAVADGTVTLKDVEELLRRVT